MNTQERTNIVLQKAVKIIGLVVLCVIALFFLFPLLWEADATFRPAIEIFNTPPQLIQHGFASFASYTLDNMAVSLIKWNAGLAFLNSVIVTVGGIGLTILVCSVCAYAFAFLNFPLKKALFMIAIATMMIPMTTMIVPAYRVIVAVGLIDNPLGLIIPYAVSAFSLFLLRQYFVTIPFSFIESAKMDGANDLRIHFSIILPLARPVLAAMAITQFRVIWNDFLMPMIILRSQEFHTLTVKMQTMDSMNIDKPYPAIIATGFICALVPVIFFLIFQRQFIEGITGGIKR